MTSLSAMVMHWSDILTATKDERRKGDEKDEMMIFIKWAQASLVNPFMRNYIKEVLSGKRRTEELEAQIEFIGRAMIDQYLHNKIHGHLTARGQSWHGQTIKDCYENLHNPNYTHHGHGKGHKCLWERYLMAIAGQKQK